MALEAVVAQQQEFLVGYNSSTKDLYSLLGGGNWSCEFDHHHHRLAAAEEEDHASFGSFDQSENYFHHENWSNPSLPPPSLMVPSNYWEQWGGPTPNYSSSEATMTGTSGALAAEEFFSQLELESSTTTTTATTTTTVSVSTSTRPKRRRSKTKKNKEEIENQRMTHIAVERNRRKQMNDYLSLLRGLMPDSYVQRGDQASIVGGAINYVKELEQRLQFLGGHKHVNEKYESSSSSTSPFGEFFSFPQYSTSSSSAACGGESSVVVAAADACAENGWAVADIEVTMVESHANLKIRSKRRPKQLLKMVSGLQSLRLTILHLNVTTVDQIVLYSLSVKIEDDCKLTSVDEIATAVNQMLGRIHQEATLLF